MSAAPPFRPPAGGSAGHAAEANLLLRHLPAVDYARLAPDLAEERMSARRVLYEPGARLTHQFFPQRGILSLMTVFDDGSTVEAGIVGREGMVGVAALLGAEHMPRRCVVQVEAVVRAIPLERLREHAAPGTRLSAVLLRYAQGFFDQVTQAGACNRRHSLDQRCARWLLQSHDRLDDDAIPVTQEFLADVLGVHRPAVATVLGRLRTAGLVRLARGGLHVVDRRGLEQAACECYARLAAHALAPLGARV